MLAGAEPDDQMLRQISAQHMCAVSNEKRKKRVPQAVVLLTIPHISPPPQPPSIVRHRRQCCHRIGDFYNSAKLLRVGQYRSSEGVTSLITIFIKYMEYIETGYYIGVLGL